VEKKFLWLKSSTVLFAAVLVISGALLYMDSGSDEEPFGSGRVEAAAEENPGQIEWPEPTAEVPAKDLNYRRAQIAVAVVPDPAVSEEDESKSGLNPENEADNSAAEKPADGEKALSGQSQAGETKDSAKVEEPIIKPITSQSAETVNETPSASADTAVQEEITVKATSPASYRWGSSKNYTFRMEVRLTNNGSDTARNIRVAVPLLENSSPYQTTSLKSVNYSAVSSSGRVSTFNIGDLAPGQSKTITADFNITVRTVSVNSSNETVEKARKVYEKYAGSGNCRTLARGFISECKSMGIKAREVVGFARPQRGAMTAGSLQGCRHSWAEFYVDGLGWVPVDLTFKYFGELPHTSHIIESYGDKSLQVNFTGGKLSASWSNAIL